MITQFEIKNRFTGNVQFTAEIECDEDTSLRVKIGLAVRWAIKSDADLRGANLSDANLSGANLSDANLSGAYLSGADLSGANLSDANLSGANLSDANLRGADLRGADLSGADLSGADLRGANLSGADLSGADLRGANLQSFKADLWMILTQNPAEVGGLVKALEEGRVDGSTYNGECACLVGTIANVRGVPFDQSGLKGDSSRPAEQWFLMIRKGDKPTDDTGGGFAAKQALEWIAEWQGLQSPAKVGDHPQ